MKAKGMARRVLWEVMELSPDDPGLEGLGELPEGLEYSYESEEDEEDKDEADNPLDIDEEAGAGSSPPSSSCSRVQVSS